MKKFIFLGFLVIVSYNILFAQVLSTEWIRTLRGSDFEQITATKTMSNGNIILAGYFQGDLEGQPLSTGVNAGFISCFNDQGQLIWNEIFESSSLFRIYDIVIDDADQIFFTGTLKGNFIYSNDTLIAPGKLDIIVGKTTANGSLSWIKEFGSSEDDVAYSIDLSPSGDIFIGATISDTIYFQSNPSPYFGLRDALVARLDSSGNTIWMNVYGGPGFDELECIKYNNGMLYVSGIFSDAIIFENDTVFSEGFDDIFIIKSDTSGINHQINGFGGPTNDFVTDLEVSGDRVYVCGWFGNYLNMNGTVINGNAEEDAYVVAYDTILNHQWTRTYASFFDDRLYSLDVHPNQDVYVFGTFDSILIVGQDTLLNRHLNRPTDVFVSAISKNGQIKWSQDFGYIYIDIASDLIIEDYNTLYLSGIFQDSSIFMSDTLLATNQYYDIYLSKVLIDTLLPVSKFENKQKNIRIYPVPASEFLNIELSNPNYDRMEIYDLMGALMNSIKINEKNTLHINLNHYKAGLYVIIFHAEEKKTIHSFLIH